MTPSLAENASPGGAAPLPQHATAEGPNASGPSGFRYDAFISYRHAEADRYWAKWLHASLETYRVPKKLAREKNLPRRVGRVFRDEEELPASDNLNAEIESALSQSRFLVVVCSPRTPESRWVGREIERFREMGRDHRILALLIEGEPAESFPRPLREVRRTVTDGGGTIQRVERVEEVEPLAADVRSVRSESGRYLRRMAKLRLLACLLGVSFDELRRREQERRARLAALAGAVLSVLLCVVGGLAIYAFHERNLAVRARHSAELRRQEAVDQRRRAEVELAQGTVLQGDLLGSANRWPEAREKYLAAGALFRRNDADPVAAELGLWDSSRHVSAPLATLTGHAGAVTAVAVSPDGRRALSGDTDHALNLWDLPAGKLLTSLPGPAAATRPIAGGPGTGHTGAIHAVAFLPRGNRALSAAEDRTVRLWDLGEARELHVFTGHAAGVTALTLLPGGSRFVSGDSAGTVKLWDLAAGSAAGTFDTHAPITCLAVSPDGRQMLCGGGDGKARLFDLTTGELLQTLPGTGLPLSLAAFLPGGKTAITGGFDNVFQIWELNGGPGASAEGQAASQGGDKAADKPRRSFTNPTSRVGCAVLSPGGRSIVAGMWDGVLKSFDVESGQVRRSLLGHDAMVRQVAVTPDGRIAVTASSDKTVRVWDLGGGRALRSWHYGGSINGVAFVKGSADASADGSAGAFGDGLLAFTAPGGRPMELWDVASEQTLFTARQPRAVFFSAVAGPDGRSALAAGLLLDGGPVLALCDLTGVRPPLLLPGHQGTIADVAVSPDGRLGLSGGDDKTARVWDLSNPGNPAASASRELHRLPHAGRVSLVGFSPDGRLALTGGLGDGLRLWDARDWHELPPLAPPAKGIEDAWSAAAFSPDSRHVLTGTQAGTVKLFDLLPPPGGALAVPSTGPSIRFGTPRTFAGAHTKPVGRLAFTPDGRRAVSAGDDYALRLWDVASGRELRVLMGHEASVREVAFSPDGRSLLSGGLDKVLCLWDFGSADAEAAAVSAVSAARAAADRSPGDKSIEAKLLVALGSEYALRGLDDWAITVLERARAGGATVSPLLLGRCYWRAGLLKEAYRELTKAKEQKEAPADYLDLCLGRMRR